jgi:hypothetical protein
MNTDPNGYYAASQARRIAELAENPFKALTQDQRQLLVCALAGNHPPRLAHLRMDVLRMLAKADRSAPSPSSQAPKEATDA